MFLNFSVDENVAPTVRTAQKFKGGSWRDRLKAKRSVQRAGRGAEEKRKDDANTVPISDRRRENQTPRHAGRQQKEQLEEFPEPRPAKRRRENDHAPSSNHVAASGQRRHEQKPVPSGQREVISSLFTYNPKPSTAPQEPSNDEEKPAAPSNAPLIDGLDTFTSLGLSSTIAAHLLTKMELKTPTGIQKAAISQMLKDDSDAFIQSETGSGKTLAYLLPLVQRIMTMSEKMKEAQADYSQNPLLLHRDSGLFALVLAPTRELCKQISVVLERLLGCARYIVAGHVIGGEKKKSEKARLRKGLNILVATPGRLVDHLENTKVLDVSNVRWLVLDEGDRLMDLGFEEDITKIVNMLDQKKRPGGSSKWPGLPQKRTTVLCSATMKMNVQKLGEISLKDAALIKNDTATEDQNSGDRGAGTTTNENGTMNSAFLAPAQLKQSYIVVAAKLRFVTLTALLKRTFARKGSVMKAIVFLSCADSVEFHFKAFTTALESENQNEVDASRRPSQPDAGKDSDAEDLQAPKTSSSTTTAAKDTSDSIHSSPVLSSPSNPLTLYKLHGSLPQATRTSIVNSFAQTTTPSLLLATDVASRGLDLPNLDLVIEYDPAFSTDDHLHRIGRTARLGRDGRAIIFLLPGKEEGYVTVLKSSYRQQRNNNDGGETSFPDGTIASVTSLSADEILKRGFTPSNGVIATKKDASTQQPWDVRATNLQLALERWVLSTPTTPSSSAAPALKPRDLSRKAFQSHIRAYATHTATERKWFDIKDLHLGHLCKSFGLRETPSGVGAGRNGNRSGGDSMGRRRSEGESTGAKRKRGSDGADGAGGTGDRDGTAVDRETDEAARKMREKVRMNRKMMMGGGGADEFNIA